MHTRQEMQLMQHVLPSVLNGWSSGLFRDAAAADLLEVEAMLLKPVQRKEESSYERKFKTLLQQCRLLPKRARQLKAEVSAAKEVCWVRWVSLYYNS